jgi:hypothetical protein
MVVVVVVMGVGVAQSSGVLIVGAPCVCGLLIDCSIAKA